MLGLLVITMSAGAHAQPQCCGDCTGDGTVTVDDIVVAVNNSMNGCQLAPTPTAAPMVTESRFPASGQKTSYGAGSDGDVRAGAPFAFADNGDGTITDTNTGLMWEKKDDSGGVHDKDNLYTWGLAAAPYTMDGTMVSEFLATLNYPPCFAGYCDWRLPNVKELLSLVDYEVPLPGPTVDAAFHDAETCTGCTNVSEVPCSCTASNRYWSSATYRFDPANAWTVTFSYGNVIYIYKSGLSAVRAVRGGL